MNKVAIGLVVQTVQVPQVQVVEKDSRSSTGAVCGQGRCCACRVAKGGAMIQKVQRFIEVCQ